MEVVSPPCPARALRLALLGLGLWVGAQKMVLQRFGGGRDLVSPCDKNKNIKEREDRL